MYEKELKILKVKNRLRSRQIYKNIIDLASNDYLCLAENKTILDKAYQKLKEFNSHSAKASIVINGYHPAHRILEEKLLQLNGFEEAIILGSGFLGNLAIFELGRKGDLFLVDEEYHASGILGSKLTQAKVIFFKHNSIEDLKNKSKNYKEFKRVFIVVEGIYSMLGDEVEKEILDYALDIGYLIIDEAHSVGIVGNNLMGITDKYNLDRKKTIKLGTLGKALGSYGAYILANREIIQFLLNKAKSIIYTTALSPIDALLAYYSLIEIENNLSKFKKIIEKRYPLITIIEEKDNKTLLEKKEILENKGILIGAIRPPTTPKPIYRIIKRVCIEENLIENVIKILKEKSV